MSKSIRNNKQEKNYEYVCSAPKYWELIAKNLSDAGWSWGYVPFLNADGGKLFCVDAHRDDGKRYIVHSDQLLTAFDELEQQTRSAIQTR